MEQSSSTFMKMGTMFEPAFVSLGFSILAEHLRTTANMMIAAYTPSYADHRRQRETDVQDSIAFVKGSGLDLLLEALDDRVDPDAFRETFFTWVDYQRRCQMSHS